MKLFKYKFLRTMVIAVAAVVTFTGCEDDDDIAGPSPTDNADAKLAARADFSFFKAAVERAKLTNFTKGGGPFTFFVPSDAAFQASGISSVADINQLDSNLLVTLITYHIQNTRRSYVEIPLGPNANMVTQGGLTQYASRKLAPATPAAYINGIKITESDIRVSNGYIHVLDKVLLPPVLTTAQALAGNPNYARFAQAITKTSTVITTSGLTVFAVDNATMIAAGYDSTTIANITSPGAALTTLTNIMKLHTVARRIFSPDFVPGVPLKTVQGGNLTVAGNIGSFTLKGAGNPTPFQVAASKDVITTTGVVLPVSGLLKP